MDAPIDIINILLCLGTAPRAQQRRSNAQSLPAQSVKWRIAGVFRAKIIFCVSPEARGVRGSHFVMSLLFVVCE